MQMHFLGSILLSERILGRIDTSETLIHGLSRCVPTTALVGRLIPLIGLDLGLRGGVSAG